MIRLVSAITNRVTSLLPLIAVVLQPYDLSASFLASLLNRNETDKAGSFYILHPKGTREPNNPSICSLIRFMCPRSFSGAPRQSHLYGIYRLYMFRPKHRVRTQSCSFIALEGKLLSLYILNSQFPPVSNTDGLLILISSFTSSLIKWISPADIQLVPIVLDWLVNLQ